MAMWALGATLGKLLSGMDSKNQNVKKTTDYQAQNCDQYKHKLIIRYVLVLLVIDTLACAGAFGPVSDRIVLSVSTTCGCSTARTDSTGSVLHTARRSSG